MVLPSYSSEDTKYGLEKENKLHSFFNSYFETEFKTTNHFNIDDYVCETKKIIIELKSRRCKYNDYPTSMISLYKIKALMRKVECGYKVYIFFNFTDGLYFHCLDRLNESYIQSGGRMDRGRVEIKNYYFIPINELNNVDLSDELPRECPALVRQNAMGGKSIYDYFQKK